MSSTDLASIFRENISEYIKTRGLSVKQWKVVNAIMNCRTAAMGGHLYHCCFCHKEIPCYNPCRDRHCPNCQYLLKEQWIKKRLKELLPVPYYHVVFTLPHALNDLISYNRRLLYNLLFRCVRQTLAHFARDERYLGAQCGYIALLHTWGQSLTQHVHLHIIMAGGGITADGEWKNVPYHGRFLFPVKAVGKMFRGKFISQLRQLHQKGELVIPDSLECFRAFHVFDHMLDGISHKKWRVYCKKPFGDAGAVVRYIGRYSHRVAISNRRILDVGDQTVCFSYKDYKGHRKGGELQREMRLSATEFMHRFILHILPQGFNKIRFYGFWGGRAKDKLSTLLKEVSHPDEAKHDNEEEDISSGYYCPYCKGLMVSRMIMKPFYYTVNYADTS